MRVHPGQSVVPEYRHTNFKICMVFLTVGFARERAEKRLDLKSLKGQGPVGARGPEFLSLRLPLKAL